MRMIDGLLAELEQEAETTRRVLERIPQAHLSWKPHAKSMSLGQLALHVATVPGNVAEAPAENQIDWIGQYAGVFPKHGQLGAIRGFRRIKECCELVSEHHHERGHGSHAE